MECYMSSFFFLCLLISLFFQSQFTYSSSSSSSLPSFNSSLTHLCSREDYINLLQFKNSLTILPLSLSNCDLYASGSIPKTTFWKEGTDCCTWDGVMCDKMTSHVIGLDLSCSNIATTLHSNSSLFLLRHLRRLNLAYNVFKFTPNPHQIGRLTGLTHLNLTRTIISRQIPSELSHLSKLVSLDLSLNLNVGIGKHQFEGLVQNLTDLRELILDQVNLSSIDPFFLKNLSSSLTSLRLSGCGMHGNLPENVVHLPNLYELDLSENGNLNYYFPSVNWTSPLRILDLMSTSFSDKLWNSIGNILKDLTYLDLSHTYITKFPYPLSVHLSHLDLSQNQLTGLIPSSITNLTRLVFLDLSNNKLAGSIPSDITWSRPNLTDLMLNDNELNGTLPSWFYYLPSLTNLDLSSNRLTGHVNEFRSRTLTRIVLHNNEFQGPIPTSILEQVDLLHLDLSSNNFNGRVNFEMFSKLSNLSFLDLSRNKLSIVTDNFISNSTLPMLSDLRLASCNLSEFPNFLKSLVKKSLAALDLSNNKIGGLIPKEMGQIVSLNASHNLLEGFDQSNMLQGSLPVLSDSMQVLLLANNKLSGVIPLSICNMQGLQLLDLSNNSFNGSIPPCSGSFNRLLVLNLGMNHLHGPIPPMFESECSLQTFDVSENQLEGSIPRSLANCTNLEVLNLSKNNITDTFPFWLDILSKLQVLILKSNRFHGPILSQQQKRVSSFSRLNIIDLSFNNFSGKMPSKFFERLNSMAAITDSKLEYMKRFEIHVESRMVNKLQVLSLVESLNYYYDSVAFAIKGLDMRYGKIPTILKAVDFSNNHFEGEIPKSVGNLKSLVVLNFSGNGFTGPIPSSFGNLSKLESLDLSKNKLSGEIPTQLTGLTFLSYFDVSQNYLVGNIPLGRQFETFSNTSYEKNSGLCGPPLSKKCRNTSVESPPSTSEENQSSYKFGSTVYDWIVVVMGYISGLVIGWVGGTFIFDKKKTWFMKILGVGLRQRGKWMNKNKRNLRGR